MTLTRRTKWRKKNRTSNDLPYLFYLGALVMLGENRLRSYGTRDLFDNGMIFFCFLIS